MTASELATFLREDYPEMLRVYEEAGFYPASFRQMKDALTAAVGLLREVEGAASKPLVVMKKRFPANVSYAVDHLEIHQENSKALADVLATLRLVVGEKEPA